MPLNTQVILLVEDNESDVALARRALLKNGIEAQVIVASDGVEALDYLFCTGLYATRDAREQPAVVLLDLKLPKLNGLDVIGRMRADPRTRRTPIAVLTSSIEPQDLGWAYDLGVNSYLRKPVNYDDFSSVMGQLAHYWLRLNQMPPQELRP